MFWKQIKLANTVIRVDSSMQLEWGGDLALFSADGQPSVRVLVRYAEIGEDVGYHKVEESGDGFIVTIPQGVYPRLSLRQVLSMLPMESILMERGTLILHASFVLYKGHAIIFSGPSGIGKSTQGELWKAYADGVVVNGDRVLLTPMGDGVQIDSHYLSGTSGICSNATAPLKAIVLLDQGPENCIRMPSALERFKRIICQLSYYPDNPDHRIRITGLAEKLLAVANVIHYTCRKDESAVHCLKEYLSLD